MRLVDRLMGKTGIHVFLCECMSAKFQEIYRSRSRLLVVMNPVELQTHSIDRPRVDPTRRKILLGHLSNLTVEKGLDTVLEVFSRIAVSSSEVELILAGPSQGHEKQLIEEAQAAHPGRIKYLGPLYNKAKNDFFASIDIFLFPSRYRTEAQPLVLAEALASGVPVIASNRGCIKDQIADGGVAVDGTGEFFKAVEEFVQEALQSETFLDSRRQQAADRARQIVEASQQDFDRLIKEIHNKGAYSLAVSP